MWKLSPTKEKFPLVKIEEIASFSAIEEISLKVAKVAKLPKCLNRGKLAVLPLFAANLLTPPGKTY
jgi:hypothetical protein